MRHMHVNAPMDLHNLLLFIFFGYNEFRKSSNTLQPTESRILEVFFSSSAPTNFTFHSFHKESAATTKMNSRHRPLHTCGVSLLAICDLACSRTQDFSGPLGSSLRRVTKFACPFIYAMQYQWLAILSFIDDNILTVEKMIEKLFPPSAYVFDKIDQLVVMIESVPEKMDDGVNKFPAIVHQIPLIEWALIHLISWLNCLIFTLNRWGSENSRIKEITVDVDMKGNEKLQGSASEGYHSLEYDGKSKENYDISEDENNGAVMPFKSSQNKGTYTKREKEEKTQNENEKGEKGREGQSEKNIEEGEDESQGSEEEEMDSDEDEEYGSIQDEDPILQLLNSGCLIKN